MPSAYSKSYGYKKFSVHTNTKNPFSNYSIMENILKKLRFRGSFYADTSAVVWTEGNRNNKIGFPIYPVWTGPVVYTGSVSFFSVSGCWVLKPEGDLN